ncbi:demethylmenaquinone methyltransferase / 2-methoxy-6-polyprenyl-1,4-benzoquinol methylase [Dehalogenimonas formicexedens]|uniref:Demethylmenaquinone methyltransferase / 2-methoxy-6-polyprenyl-1,4-benzoquinol methylase n=1 Tax=Dehalogenimonas formicexedens TaxID=1839801 RepID=A0A1P8F8F7_9CHLR|nr:methyltransferase domain-containing protein [Dehalogenimonas formicexedens]APV44759.1 demethylmenaquinone methyltransferase / 2-methoxy-6-polyprenyl-1,4-benzoquinol methylase [Dehalogenimonas formicexedens]
MAETSQEIKTPAYYSVAYWRKWAGLYDRTTKLAFLPFGGEKRFRRKFVAGAHLKDTDQVLDICCGTGSTTAIIAEEVNQGKIIGVDLSPDMLAVARKKVPAQWVGFERASVDALPFGDNSFDAVLCTYGLHEIPRAIRAGALKEVFRVLRPGGKFMTMDYNLPHRFPARQAVSAFVRIFEHDVAYQMMRGSLAGEVEESGLRVLRKKEALGGMFQIIESVKD